MTNYTFKITDDGIFGKAFEMAVKEALNRKNPNSVSPCGTADFRYHSKNYDTKQNGSCVRYNPSGLYVKGSNRVIYAVHIAHTVVYQDEKYITLSVDLANTEMYCVDKKAFITFLLSINGVKLNSSRGTANIQTSYNYNQGKYHGKKGHIIEAWCQDNSITDTVIDDILDGIK